MPAIRISTLVGSHLLSFDLRPIGKSPMATFNGNPPERFGGMWAVVTIPFVEAYFKALRVNIADPDRCAVPAVVGWRCGNHHWVRHWILKLNRHPFVIEIEATRFPEDFA